VTRRHAPEPCDETLAKSVPTPAKAEFHAKKRLFSAYWLQGAGLLPTLAGAECLLRRLFSTKL
jgi:hypothetical protein